MKMLKKLMIYILVCICLLGAMPQMEVMAAKTKYSGTSGNIHWKVDSDGTLTLSGKGVAYRNYNYNGEFTYEWLCYREEVKKVVVNISGIEDTTSFFKNLKNVKSVDLRKFDTSKVTDMTDMFNGCESLTKLDVNSFNTKNVTVMASMFQNCKNIKTLNLSSFDTSKVTSMANMFNGCEKLTEVNLTSFDTRNLASAMNMFAGCKVLKQLDLSGFDTSQLAGIEGMFANCNKLSTTLTLNKIPTMDRGIFVEAATAPKTKITLNYGGEYTIDMARDLVGSKGVSSNIVLGKKRTLRSQTIKVKNSSKTVNYSSLKKSAMSFSIGASAKTSLTYKATVGSKYLSVDKKGKVTVKKGTPKGTYRIAVTAKGSSK